VVSDRNATDAFAPVHLAVVVRVLVQEDLVVVLVERDDHVVLAGHRFPLGALQDGPHVQHGALHVRAGGVDGGPGDGQEHAEHDERHQDLDQGKPAGPTRAGPQPRFHGSARAARIAPRVGMVEVVLWHDVIPVGVAPLHRPEPPRPVQIARGRPCLPPPEPGPSFPAMPEPPVMEKLVSLCKRRGFVFQSSEIYGGLGSVWDYGPLGVELKKNVKDRWWGAMVHARDDIEGLDAAILMHPRVWEASGHVAGFADPLVDCRTCKARFRADRLGDFACPQKPSKHPGEHSACDLTEPRLFNLMFKTFLGPVEEQAAVVYLRPETAQGIYVNYLNVLNSSRQKVPFGIAQIGKAFRNEITPGNFIFRTREFEQMEMQFFVKPGTDEEWFERWRGLRMAWYHEVGLRPERLRWHAHGPDELAHYARAAFDIEYEFPFGWHEIEGIHNRTDFDLARHQEYSAKKLEYFDQDAGQRYLPYIIETSAGADRVALTLLVDAYREEQVEGETRVVLGLHPAIAPIKVAVLPLVRKDGMPETALSLYHDLRRRVPAFYDDSGAIGRRYRRQDEAGTPFCVTVDGQTAADRTVTIRQRDAMTQERVALDAVEGYVGERIRHP
jgi:glycyl-tRNA synthetase